MKGKTSDSISSTKAQTAESTRSFKICTTVIEEDVEEACRIAEEALAMGSDLVEIRLDALKDLNVQLVREHLSPFVNRCVLTLRSGIEGGFFTGKPSEYSEAIASFADMKPAYVDVEIRMLPSVNLMEFRKANLILSYHNLKCTPRLSVLKGIRDQGSKLGLVKLVTRMKKKEDQERVFALYSGFEGRLVAFCIGKEGLSSRLRSISLGAPLVYAAYRKSLVSEELGQPSLRQMLDFKRSLLN
ncbi:MAG: type I 3-dehydroquinate dehydratase [Conexivisphaerales archaeon]